MLYVAFCYRVKNRTVARHPRSISKEPKADACDSDTREKHFDSIKLFGINPSRDQMAPALLYRG